jgi:uncharacterized membrane protein
MIRKISMVALQAARAVFVVRAALASLFVVALALGLAPAAAFAQTTTAPGWGQTLTNFTALSDQTQTLIMALPALLGVIALLYAGMLFWKKSNRETASEVKTSHIAMAIVGGVFLLSIALVVRNSVTTAGGSSTDVGRRTLYNGSGD